MILKEEGFEYRGFKLGQNIVKKDNNKIYKIIGFETKTEGDMFIAIKDDCNQIPIKKSSFFLDIAVLSGHEESGYCWIDKNDIKEDLKHIECAYDGELEDVLQVEYIETFEKYAVRISYQNEDVLKRGEFRDEYLKVKSVNGFQYSDMYVLFLRGVDRSRDNCEEILTKEQFDDVMDKVRMINQKYGLKKLWRANYGGCYWYIQGLVDVNFAEDKRMHFSNSCYETGNYFRTKEDAELYLDKFKRELKERV